MSFPSKECAVRQLFMYVCSTVYVMWEGADDGEWSASGADELQSGASFTINVKWTTLAVSRKRNNWVEFKLK